MLLDHLQIDPDTLFSDGSTCGNNESPEDIQHKNKIRCIYGTRASSRILSEKASSQDSNKPDAEKAKPKHDHHGHGHNAEPEKSLLEKMIIRKESTWKSIFDIFILFCVGYSCITAIYNVAFSPKLNNFFQAANIMIELFFWIDIVLNFFHAYYDNVKQVEVTSFRLIAKNYLSKWFFIDFIAVFPFNLFFTLNPMLTKLFRLFRMPRLIKLLDI